MRLTLKPLGPVETGVLESLRKGLPGFDEVVVGREGPLPETGYNRRRQQYLASSLFEACLLEPGERVLGVTEADLYEIGLNFVFGYSQPNGRMAVISLARLHDPDNQRFLDRCLKEAVHEIGHTLGLKHDKERAECVMHFSRTLADTDRKRRDYCAACGSEARVTLKHLRR
jgi:archaemetzincin